MTKIILTICYVFLLFVNAPGISIAQDDPGYDSYQSDLEEQARQDFEQSNADATQIDQGADNFDICDHETDYGAVESSPCSSHRNTSSQSQNNNGILWFWGSIFAVGFVLHLFNSHRS